MILINLLPPELRKRQGGGTSLNLGLVACYAAALIPICCWAWLKYTRLPEAERTRQELTEKLDQKTQEATEVEALQGKIGEFESHRDQLISLLSRKVYWARTLDAFVNHLNAPNDKPWQGFEVCCTDLTITPGQSGNVPVSKKGDQIFNTLRGKFKLIGLQRDNAGDYIKEFFLRTAESKFWSQQGFVGKPEETYRGDNPDWRVGIGRVVVETTLEWTRVKRVATAADEKPAAKGM